MKKITAIILTLALVLMLFGCGKKTENPPEEQPTDASQSEDGAIMIKAVIADGAETGDLIFAGENAGDLYTASAGIFTVYLDGEKADASVLKDGMHAEIKCSSLLETYPMSFGNGSELYVYSYGSEKEPKDSYYDVCGMCLAVLDDLWEDDNGLNNDIEYISVDLSAVGNAMTESEKNAVAWIFAGKHSAQALMMTFDQLCDEGYVNRDELYWKNGLLFSIKQNEGDSGKTLSGKPGLSFDASKWRSGLGAIFFTECKAEWNAKGEWTYETGGFAIA